MGFPFTIFVPHAAEGLLNSHHTKHFSVNRLTSYEILLLIAPHVTFLCCNNLNPASLLPSIIDEAPHDYLMLTDHLLTPHDDLTETPLDNADFSWLTDGSYLKGDNGKYCARYAIATHSDVIEAAPLPIATSDQQPELHALTWAQARAKLPIFILIVDMFLE